MKKIILTLFLVSFLFLPLFGMAQPAFDVGVGLDEPAPYISLDRAIENITNILFALLIAAAVIFIIIGAFGLMTAGGDDTKLTEARKKILYAIIAVVIAILARGVVNFIIQELR